MKTNKYSGTKTEQNLRTAFSGESEARNKYTFFASTAKKEGYEQIAALFQKTADNEKEHAKMWFKELQGIGSTAGNLLSAAEGENYEWTDMYDSFAIRFRQNGHERQHLVHRAQHARLHRLCRPGVQARAPDRGGSCQDGRRNHD